MIRRFLALPMLLLLAFGAPVAAGAGDALDEADRQAIRSVIEAQLAAFQADDGETAFGFASPTIQEMFGNPANFLAMVRTGYHAGLSPARGALRAAGRPIRASRSSWCCWSGPTSRW